MLLVEDRDTQRIYRLHDFSKTPRLQPGVAYYVAGKVHRSDKPYLVVEPIRLDATRCPASNAPVPADGAGGSDVS